MKTYHITLIIICTILVIGAIICEVIRRKHYQPSAQLTKLKQPLSIENAKSIETIDGYTNISQLIPQHLRDIKHAKEYVFFQFFKFEKDSLGIKIQEALIDKAQDGVPVFVIYDAFPGAIVDHSFFHEMRLYGVEVHRYNPIFPLPSIYSNYRNHRKIVVIDGQIGYIGGMNIAQRYLTGVHNGEWRDTHLRITGAACQDLQRVFFDDWSKQRKPYEAFPVLMEDANDGPSASAVQIIASDPQDRTSPILQAIIQMAESAQQYLYIQSPYFLPPKSLQTALCQAAKRGVDVRLMIPQRGDRSIFVSYASRSYLKPLLEAGVKVFFHNTGFIHAKMVMADGKITTVGSANIDFRSFTQNSEANAFVYDEAFARYAQKIFIDDMHNCHMITQDWWKKRYFKERLLQTIVKPFVHIM